MALTVEKIENGTVIDHITSGKGMKVLAILKIDESYAGRVALVMNVPSKMMGKKDIVKIEGRHIDDKTANKIALLAPNANLNLIKNFEVIEKKQVKMPNVLIDIAPCPNPMCVANHERIESRFSVEKKGLRCGFCERLFRADELV